MMLDFPILAVWPFASAWLLLWGIAAATPILIHLWNRRRYDEVPWAAMEYLLAAVKKNARRIRIEQLLLLIIRVLILLLFALALADPFWPFLKSLGGALSGGGHTHWVIVIDGSYSMDYRRGDENRFEQAKKMAAELVAEGQQGDGYTLVLMANPPQTVIVDPAFDARDVTDEIQQLRMRHDGANLTATLAATAELVSKARRKHRRLAETRVTIFSDLGQTTWSAMTETDAMEHLDKLSDQSVVTLVDLGEEGGDNLAITSLTMKEPVAAIGRDVLFNIDAANFGNSAADSVAITLFVDQRPIHQERVNIPAGDTVSINVSHRFENAGDHSLEARIEDPRLTIDNHRYLSVPVRESIRVLCISGKTGAAHLVHRGLNPFVGDRPYVDAELANETALLERNLNDYDAIFLCNVARIGRDEASLMNQYVRSGGGLAIFLGDQVRAESYNNALLKSKTPLLPAELSSKAVGGEQYLTAKDYRHPLVEPFRGNETAGLFTLPTHRYFKLTPQSELNPRPALWFDNGDIALVEATVGRGRVLLFATAGSERSLDRGENPPIQWTLTPNWLNYPALLQQMLRTVIRGRDQQRNTLVGDSIEDTVYGVSASIPLSITSPDGENRRVQMQVAGEENRWRFDNVWESGVYEARYGAPLSTERIYTANINTKESELTRIDPLELPEKLNRQAQLAADDSPVLPNKPSPKLFRYLLIAVGLLLFVETDLARRFGGSRS